MPTLPPVAAPPTAASNEIVIDNERGICGAYPAVCMMCGAAEATRMDPRTFTWVNPWALLALVLGPLGLTFLVSGEARRTAMVHTCSGCHGRSWGLRPSEIVAVVALFVVSVAGVAAWATYCDDITIYGCALVVVALLAHLLRGNRTNRIWASRITCESVVLRLPNTRYAALYNNHLRQAVEAACLSAETREPSATTKTTETTEPSATTETTETTEPTEPTETTAAVSPAPVAPELHATEAASASRSRHLVNVRVTRCSHRATRRSH